MEKNEIHLFSGSINALSNQTESRLPRINKQNKPILPFKLPITQHIQGTFSNGIKHLAKSMSHRELPEESGLSGLGAETLRMHKEESATNLLTLPGLNLPNNNTNNTYNDTSFGEINQEISGNASSKLGYYQISISNGSTGTNNNRVNNMTKLKLFKNIGNGFNSNNDIRQKNRISYSNSQLHSERSASNNTRIRNKIIPNQEILKKHQQKRLFSEDDVNQNNNNNNNTTLQHHLSVKFLKKEAYDHDTESNNGLNTMMTITNISANDNDKDLINNLYTKKQLKIPRINNEYIKINDITDNRDDLNTTIYPSLKKSQEKTTGIITTITSTTAANTTTNITNTNNTTVNNYNSSSLSPSRLYSISRQKDKNHQQLEFRIKFSKKSIFANKFPLRVFVTLLKNMKLYYQLIEDALDQVSSSIDQLQKNIINKANLNKKQFFISGDISLLKQKFDQILPEVQALIEENKKHTPSSLLSNKKFHEYLKIQREKAFTTFIIDKDVEPKEKSKPPHELLHTIIQDLILLIDDSIINRRKYITYETLSKKLISLGQQSGNLEIQLSTIKKAGRIFFEKKDYQGAATMFKQYKNICHAFVNDINRLKAYKHLGKCYQYMQKYKVALIYFTKMLQLAWHSNNKDYEMLAYDFIGIQYYYIGELEKAQYYHEKMTRGKPEENQSLVQLGIQKIKNPLAIDLDDMSNDGNNPHSSMGYQDQINTLTLRMQLTRNCTNLIVVDGIEISSGDEFELPIPDYDSLRKLKEKERLEQEKLFNKKELDDIKRKEIERLRTYRAGISRIHNQNTYKDKNLYQQQGLQLPLSLSQQQQHHQQQQQYTTERFHTDSDNHGYINMKHYQQQQQMPYCETEGPDLSNPKFTITSNQANPSEKIYINHLSRNRGIDNFNESSINNGSSGVGYTIEALTSNDQIDIMTAEKIKKVLEKYRANLVIIKNGIEALFPFNAGRNKKY